jgi:adenylate cyclase
MDAVESSHEDPKARPANRLEAAFALEEARAQEASAPVLLAAIAVITAWITFENGFPKVLFYYPFMVGFVVIGTAGVLLRRWGWTPWWERYARFALGIVLLTAIALAPNPYSEPVETAAMRLRWQNELYLFVLIAVAAFTYSPRVVLWTGAVAAATWGGAGLWILSSEGTTHGIAPEVWYAMTQAERQRAIMDPHYVFVNGLVRAVLVLLVVSGVLAAFVHRSRRIVRRHADAERQRDNLSRYFSANLVDELAESDEPLTAPRRLDAAVLFADIVGFTTMSAREEPEAVIEILRQFHRRTAGAIFTHAGTLDKFIGDEVLATVGTPRPGPTDATNSLRCAAALLASVDEWNAARALAGAPPIAIGIGIHFGPVVLGDIGSAQRLEFAVVGDTVNVASRLERLTRECDCVAIVSADAIAAARREGARVEEILPDLRESPDRTVRGREQPVALWVQSRASLSRGRPTEGGA